ncbi:cysteine--tRNA ligase [Patescibacteria group bacterium]|nr:cysteine--tRNA ligase [Patescibacteria group bacterium]
MLKLTNTLTGDKEVFTPITESRVGMYNCGPTVYDYVHIGNLRAFILADIIRRTLEFNKYEVHQVINITDIGHLASDADDGDDKMTKGLLREGKPLTLEAMKELADFYTERFKENLIALNIQLPHTMPKASEHIEEDIEFIQKLEGKNFAYKTSDGVYFDTSKNPHYGKLGGISADDSHARVESNTQKRNFKDFALWKLNPALGFESPWGKGFPGWHIECSAMSKKYLGDHFDIHTGGVDLASIHHNNEIAQSECESGHTFVNYWLHNAFVNIEGGKMAKSQGNFIRLQTLIDRNILPLAYRYWLLTAHYRTPVTFSYEAIEGAQNGYNRLIELVTSLPHEGNADENYLALFKGFINDDLDTPKAIALMWELTKDNEVRAEDKKATLLSFDKVLGLGLDNLKTVDIPEEVQKLVGERDEARKNKDFKKSDELRDEIKKLGFDVKDTTEGQRISSLLS